MQFAFRFDRQGRSLLAFDSGAPNILERSLGYEIGAGFDWKLLEGMSLHGSFAYWQPGDWFKFACVDRTQPGWDIPLAANNYGINPDRSIDPIFGTYISLETYF
jgi:hypothetical protein